MHSQSKTIPLLATIDKLGISIPQAQSLPLISGMPAACIGGQTERLGWALDKLKQLPPEAIHPEANINIFSSDNLTLKHISPENYHLWQQVFIIIKTNAKTIAEKLFKIISLLNQLESNKDILALALLKTHSKEYITKVIDSCCQAQAKTTATTIGVMPMDMTEEQFQENAYNSDLVVTAATFEFIISDLIANIENRHKIQLSINLPSHHATFDMGSGFCVFNSMAIICAVDDIIAAQHNTTITKIIVGLDVNHDDGLSDIWWHNDSNSYFRHIDIFDSRVFPLYPDCNLTEHLFEHLYTTTDLERKPRIQITNSIIANQWIQYKLDTNEYTAINLRLIQRPLHATADNPDNIHPALIFSLDKIKSELDKSKIEARPAALYIPMGWDSHISEQAGCSAFKRPKQSYTSYHQDRLKSRFTDNDMKYFYQKIASLLASPEYQDTLKSVFFTLEGGYTKQVNDKQLELFLTIFGGLQPQLFQPPTTRTYRDSRRTIEERGIPSPAKTDEKPFKYPRSSYTHLYLPDKKRGAGSSKPAEIDPKMVAALEKLCNGYKQ